MTPENHSKTRHRLWLELSLPIVSAILALVAGEVVVRKFLPPPGRISKPATPKESGNGQAMRSLHRADPVIGWVLSPEPLEYRHRLVDEDGALEYDVIYSVAHGQRRTSANPPSGPVLIATGCSFTFGHGLNDPDTWPWLLQEQLPTYHVVNIANMAYGTDQALLAAERQVTKSPGQTAAVVLGLGDFQIERNRSAQGWLSVIYPYSKPMFAITPGGVEYKGQVHIWSPPILSKSDLFAHAANIMANRAYGVVPSHQQGTLLTVALIQDFAKRFQALGVKFAVAVLPYPNESVSDQALILERLYAAGIPTIRPDFPRLPNGRLERRRFAVGATDSHPNRAYNQILVEQLGPFLKSKGIVSP
jgi:hypothetical protein